MDWEMISAQAEVVEEVDIASSFLPASLQSPADIISVTNELLASTQPPAELLD